jgi:YD repeat-containing protein
MDVSYYPNGAVSGAYMGETGIAQTFSYDYGSATCTMESVVGGSTQTTSYTYDTAGNLVDRSGSCCGGDVTYTYDAAGNILKEKDAKGYETTYTYDALGNVLTQTDAIGNVITYTYEPLFNQLATVTDPKGNVILYTYDAGGNKIREDWPEGVDAMKMCASENMARAGELKKRLQMTTGTDAEALEQHPRRPVGVPWRIDCIASGPGGYSRQAEKTRGRFRV